MSDDRHRLFDSHVHLDRLSQAQPLPEVLRAAARKGIAGWLIPGVRRCDWPALVALAEGHAGVWAAPGLHPMVADQWDEQARQELETLLLHDKVLALGEIGLDRLVGVSMPRQEQAFAEQLQLASRYRKPVLIHCRRAWGQVLEILQVQNFSTGGILHAFGGSLEVALQGVALGFAISFGGPLTYPNARRSIDVLQGLPAEAIVLETDAPDLPPHPHRQQANRPEWLTLVASRVAELRGWSLDKTAAITSANVERILGLQGPENRQGAEF